MPTITVGDGSGTIPKGPQSALCVQTDGTLPKKIKITGVPAGAIQNEVTLVEPKTTISYTAALSSANFHDVSTECPDVSVIAV